MATKVLVNGKFQSRAGVYATITSAIKNPSQVTTYGNVLIIDDGIGAGFGGGSGINGTLANGIDSIYSFDSLDSFQAFVKGGAVWNLAKPLFQPAVGQKGVSKVFYVQARTTTPATISTVLTNGSFDIKPKDEGLNANGVLSGSNLSTGYAGKFIKTTSGKYKFQVWHGTYKGLDTVNGIPYDGILSTLAKPQLVIESPEFVLIADLISWFTSSKDFSDGFQLSAGSTATGNFVDADLTTYPSYILATGGTEIYNSTDLDSVLTNINIQDYTHILALKSNANATHANNDKLADFVQNKSKYQRILVIAGGATKADRSVSKTAAAHYNSEKVIVIHGGVKKTKSNGGYSVYDSLYHAAAILGRCVGLEPQVPVTLKTIDVDGFVDSLTDDDQEDLIEAGVLHSYNDTELGGVNVVGLDVTTLQGTQNDNLINEDGSSYSWQLGRIKADLIKFLIFEGKKRFFDPIGNGGNRNTTSVEEVTEWAKKKLNDRTASDKKDDLIIEARNISASIEQDNIHLDFEFVPNTEIKDLVIVGTMING